MSTLEDIKGRAENALLHESLEAERYAALAWESVADIPSLVAALEAIQSLPLLVRKTNSSDDPEHVSYSEGWDIMANGYNRALMDVQDVIKGALMSGETQRG